MEIKELYDNIDPTGGSGTGVSDPNPADPNGADGGTDPTAGEEGTQKNGIFGTNDPINPNPADPNGADGGTDPSDYGFSQLEAYNGNEAYYSNLSENFNKLGISVEQAPELLKIADGILEPLIAQLQQNSPEAWNEKVETEKASFTPLEKVMAETVNGYALAAFDSQADYDEFASLFSTKRDLQLLDKFISHFTPGGNENAASGGFSSPPKGKMTLSDYQSNFDRLLAKGGTKEEIEAAEIKLNEQAKKQGDQDLLEYMKTMR